MAISQAMCTSFKVELMQALHNFNATGGDLFKLALYPSSATLGSGTTVYDGTGEIPGVGGYTIGGQDLINTTPSNPSGTTAITTFSNVTWAAATITARGALIYNSTNGNRAVAVLDFGGDKTSTAGDFTISFPAADATNAILRIA